MQQLKILYIGRNEAIRDTVVRLINKQKYWLGTGVLSDNEAKELWNSNSFDLILLGNGIDECCEKDLRTFFLSAKKNIIIIQHYGGGSGLLYSEISEALSRINR